MAKKTNPSLAKDNIQYFSATLYFDDLPTLSDTALIEASSREGNKSKRLNTDGIFDGLCGGARVFVGEPVKVNALAVPAIIQRSRGLRSIGRRPSTLMQRQRTMTCVVRPIRRVSGS